MKNFLSGTAILAVALVAAPASAQLLGGGGLGGQLGGATGMLTGAGNGSLNGMTGPVSTDGVANTRGAGRLDRSVDTRRGRVSASADASGGGAVDHATRVGDHSASANGSASGALGGGVDARLVGTDAVRDAAGRAANTAGNVAGRARDTAGAVAARASNVGGNAVGAVSGSGSAALAGAGGQGSAMGNLALAGSGAAQGGAFPVNPGMAVTDARGRAIGAVQSVRSNAEGAVQQVLVKIGDKVAAVPAANFSGSGDVLVSAMGQGELARRAD